MLSLGKNIGPPADNEYACPSILKYRFGSTVALLAQSYKEDIFVHVQKDE